MLRGVEEVDELDALGPVQLSFAPSATCRSGRTLIQRLERSAPTPLSVTFFDSGTRAIRQGREPLSRQLASRYPPPRVFILRALTPSSEDLTTPCAPVTSGAPSSTSCSRALRRRSALGSRSSKRGLLAGIAVTAPGLLARPASMKSTSVLFRALSRGTPRGVRRFVP